MSLDSAGDLLLLSCKHDLVSFALSLLEFFLGMLPLVLLASLDRFQFFLLDLARLLHNLGDVSMPPDTSYLGLWND